MKIGITERGDAACDFMWVDKCRSHTIDGAVIITKRLTDEVIGNVLNLYTEGFPLILHVTITGWGNTKMEPGVWNYKKSVQSVNKLISMGFPSSHIVIRIDPIFPTPSGIKRVYDVMHYIHEQGLFKSDTKIRLRMSIYDEYPHVCERLSNAGMKPLYNGLFQSPIYMVNALAMNLSKIRKELNSLSDVYVPVFETCAEDYIAEKFPQDFIINGCISKTDLNIMGLKCPEYMDENKQNRKGCHCLSIKTELLTKQEQCPHNCIYCYWKNS